MPTAAPGDRRWDFFVAHAGAYAARASRLAALLRAGGASVFLDAEELLPGDVWPRVLARAQARSAVTVIVVSSNTAGAYYQLEELAESIQMSRHADSGHRVAPVYLEEVERIPYGLRVGLERAAGQLLRLLPQAGVGSAGKVWSPLVPLARFFAGRDDLLGLLAAHGSHGASVLTQSVAGLGGVGKSTVAAAFFREQADANVVDVV